MLRIKIIFQILLMATFCLNPIFANDYLIFSIVQEIPMGEVAKTQARPYRDSKNFYVTMGSIQGIKPGSILDVYRNISQVDPFESNKTHQFKVKIGELVVLHTEEQASITKKVLFEDHDKAPLFEIENFMVGDLVEINLKKN